MVPVIDRAAVLAAVGPAAAIDATREAYLRHASGEWEMPSKVYVEAPPHGDFRAMPARGSGYSLLKWVTSFPDNPTRGLPVVAGAVLLSDADSGELLAIIDCASVTSLRTGAAAAVSALTLARDDAHSVGIIGCGENGAWAARCLDAAGYGDGICCDPRPNQAHAIASQLGWSEGSREQALEADVVVTMTPGLTPVINPGDLGKGSHLAAMGADSHSKAEVDPAEIGRCHLFCDQWTQAAAGGELSGPVASGAVTENQVTAIGEVLAGSAPGRASSSEITLFDSTGLAIQDLAIAKAAYEAWSSGAIKAPTVEI